MSGMGILGAALAGGAAGIGRAMSENARLQMAEESDMRRLEGAAKIRAYYAEQAIERARERAAQEAAQVETTAGEIAGKRGLLNAAGATSAYEKLAATDPEGAKLGLEAVRNAEAGGLYKQEPTTDDRYQAARGMGIIDTARAIDIERSQENTDYNRTKDEEKTAYKKEQDALDNKRKDKELTLLERSSNQAAAQNKMELKLTKIKLDQAMQEQKIPPAVKAKLAVLEKSASLIEKTLYEQAGNMTGTEEGTRQLLIEQRSVTEQMNALLEPYMPKELQGKTPAAKPPPTAADIAATAKKYNMTEQQVKDKLGIK